MRAWQVQSCRFFPSALAGPKTGQVAQRHLVRLLSHRHFHWGVRTRQHKLIRFADTGDDEFYDLKRPL